MNPSTTSMTLNMQLPNIAAVAWAVQGDQLSRYVECTLVDGSAAWNPQAGYHGVIRAHKPDGTSCVYDVDEDGNPAVTWTGNVATVTIAQQAVTVAGTVLMQLEFYDSNNARITAFAWAMNVQPSAVTDTEFLSTDYYNILTLQIAAVLGSSGNPPYINSDTKNWMIWDGNEGSYVDSGFSSVGLTGPAPALTGTAYRYANSNSGTVAPSSWSTTRPATSPGTWAWTETTLTFDNSETTKIYTCAYQGNDGQGSPGTALPLMDGIAAVGTANAYAREDHVHPRGVLKPTGDTTDRAADIATMLSTFGYCELVAGEYYIGSPITLPNKSTIKGCGKESVIKFRPGSTATTMFYITGTTGNITIKDLYLVGSNSSKPTTENTGSGEVAVALDDHANRVTIENCTFFGLTKSGISYTSGYEWLTSINVTNCTFLFCNYGISAGRYGEFAHVTNCSFNSCYYGALVVGGNNNFVNCGFDGNNTGFVLYDDSSTPTNDGHGACVGCTFNHNTGQAISISNIDNGYVFSGCCIFYGNVFISNSRGIIIDSCLILGYKDSSNFTNITVQNCPGQISITNILSANSFTINKVGTNPHILARNCRTTNGVVVYDNEPVKVVDAVTTIASINANSGASATVDVAIPSGYKALTAVVAGYTSSGCIIASCYTTTGAASGYQRVGMFVFNESNTAKTNEQVTCHVLFTPNEY